MTAKIASNLLQKNIMKPFYSIALIGLLSLFVVSPAFAEHDHKTEQASLSQLMQAISDNDYEAFVSNGTRQFKDNITQQVFDAVTGQLGKLIRGGHTTEYLSDLYQGGNTFHLWKISYANSKENSLVKLIVINGKIAGFWLL